MSQMFVPFHRNTTDPSVSIHTSSAWNSTLSAGAFHRSRLRCFSSFTGVHRREIQLTGHDLQKAHGCLYKVPQLTVHVRAQTRREVKGIACKYLRQVCLEAEIGGSVQKHICRFKGCSEHSGRRHQQVEEVEKHASSSWPAIQNEWSDKKTRRWISWWIPKWWDGSVQNSRSLYSTSSQNNLELREAKLKALELHWRLDNLDRSDVAGRF